MASVAVLARRRVTLFSQLLVLGEGNSTQATFSIPVCRSNKSATKWDLPFRAPTDRPSGSASKLQHRATTSRSQVMGDLDKLTGNMIRIRPNTSPDMRDVLRAMKKMIDGAYKVCGRASKSPLLGHFRVGSSQSLCPASRWLLSAAHCSI